MNRVIMTVDDSASVRQMVAFTLRQSGFDVVEASDGKEELGKLAVTRVDLLITDLNMPNMNGLELVKELRGGTANRMTPILMLTTESGDNRKAEARAMGVSGWIIKPFRPDQLLTVVRRIIG